MRAANDRRPYNSKPTARPPRRGLGRETRIVMLFALATLAWAGFSLRHLHLGVASGTIGTAQGAGSLRLSSRHRILRSTTMDDEVAAAATGIGIAKPPQQLAEPPTAAAEERGAKATNAAAADRAAVTVTDKSVPAWRKHTLLILDGPGATLSDAELNLDRYRQCPASFIITRMPPTAAQALADSFDVDPASLPVAIYQPPSFAPQAAHVYQPATSQPKNFTNWLRERARITVALDNEREDKVCFFWISPEGVEHQVACLQRRSTEWQTSSLLDTFVARLDADQSELKRFTVLHQGIFSVRPPAMCDYINDKACRLPKDPFPTDPAVLGGRAATEARRLTDMDRKRLLTIPFFSPTGFEKMRAPTAALRALQTYFELNRKNIIREHVNGGFIFINQYDSPPLLLPLPEAPMGRNPIKDTVYNAVAEEIRKWAGVQDLNPTALYGIRTYTNGSILLNHVDRQDTHILSAIINVAQEVEEPWPLEVYDHDGNPHHVTMEPGDMVLYEGSRSIHGRQQPLKGRWFANTFVHFQPAKTALV